MKINPLLSAISLLFVLVSGVLAQVPEASPPNILLILTDDQGFGDVGSHGNPWVQTPNMDRLAAEGARFDRFFVEPSCAPTRAALLTGRAPSRSGVFGVTRGEENLRSDEVTIAELLRDEAGYATGGFGKWHNGSQWPQHPNAQGFDEFVGFCAGHWNDYYDPVLERNGEEYPTQGFIADVITDHAETFIRENTEKKQPFFCYVPFNTPHTPASVPADDWKRWVHNTEVESYFDRAMYALCENIDANVGRLMALLKELEVDDNTIVLFLSDNGPNGERYNDGMLGHKGSLHEGGVRVPLFVRWPGMIEPGTVVKANVAHIDLLPTLSRLAGIALTSEMTKPLDGVDISPLLLGESDFSLPERNHYTWRLIYGWSVRSDRYRATATTLHDMFEDPGQENNLIEERPEIHNALKADYQKWAADAIIESPQRLPIAVGHSEWPHVTLNAHEWQVVPDTGEGIDYCLPRGWSNQWIQDWTDETAYAECPIDVVEAGSYEVSIQYACDMTSVGSVFQLIAGENSLDIEIEEPWVSAPHPAAEQGAKEPGWYLSREWKEWEAGTLALEKGKHLLQLRVKSKTGKEMADIKSVMLRKI